MKSQVLTKPVQWLVDQAKWQRRRWRGLPGKQAMIAQYWEAVEPVLAAHPDSLTREQAKAGLKPWLQSIAFSQGPLVDGWPWMPFAAITKLENRLNKSSQVFEYGVGGSSVFFSTRVSELVSVEHNRSWFEATHQVISKQMLNQQGFHWHGVLAEPKPFATLLDLQPDDPLTYCSSDESYAGQSFHDYVAVIDQYPNEYFDIVLIDGRARPSCFMHAMNKVKFGGYVILDNAERAYYHYVEETAEKLGFEIEEIWGPGPYNHYCWRTLFLCRRQRWFALNDLDRQLINYLDFDNGIFVEAGANDGIRQSNTLYFEACRNWTGLLVEAIPELYDSCRRNRPQAKVVWAALAPPEQVPGNVTLRFGGLMSVVKGGMQTKEEEDHHIEVGCEIQKLSTYDVLVPCATLSSILDEQGILHVDLLSLDIEGFEAQALKGLDLSRHRPTYILVEQRYPKAIESILLPYYEVVAKLSHHDVLYRRR